MRNFKRFFCLTHVVFWCWALINPYHYYTSIFRSGEGLSAWGILFVVTALVLPSLGCFFALGGMWFKKNKLLYLSSTVFFLALCLLYYSPLHCIALALNATMLSVWSFEGQGKETFPFHWAKFIALACIMVSLLHLSFSAYGTVQYLLFPEIFEDAGLTAFTNLKPLLINGVVFMAGLGSLVALYHKSGYLFACGAVLLCYGCWDIYNYRMVFAPLFKALMAGKLLDHYYELSMLFDCADMVRVVFTAGVFLAAPFVYYFYTHHKKTKAFS